MVDKQGIDKELTRINVVRRRIYPETRDTLRIQGFTTVIMKLSEGFARVDGGTQSDTTGLGPNSPGRWEHGGLDQARTPGMENTMRS